MNIGFKVIQRLVREKFEKMMKDYEKKTNREKGASGVSVQYSGIYRSLEDIKGRIAEINEVQQVESLGKKKEKASAEEIRKKAMEKYIATKKRHVEATDDDEEIPVPTVKRKSKQNNVSDILADSVQIQERKVNCGSENSNFGKKSRDNIDSSKNNCLSNRRKLNSNNTR